jgi:hypothetical protein
MREWEYGRRELEFSFKLYASSFKLKRLLGVAENPFPELPFFTM